MTTTFTSVLAPTALSPGASPRTLTFDIGSVSSNALLVLPVLNLDADDDLASATWASVSMAALGEIGSGTTFNLSGWAIEAPTAGSQTFSMTWTGDGTYGGTGFGVVIDSDEGVVTLGTPVPFSGTGTVMSATSQTCPAGGFLLVYGAHNFASGDPSLSSAGTSVIATRLSNKPYVFAYHNATVAFAYNALSSSQPWALTVVPVEIVSAGTPVGRADETDAALALAAVQLLAAGRSDETDAALALAAVQVAAAGLAEETSTAFALTPVQIAAAGQATEVDEADALAAVQLLAVGLAEETDTALELAAGSGSAAGLATEEDTALALSALQITAAGRADETDAALALEGQQGTAAGLATESDTAFALQAVQKLLAGMSTETDVALALLAADGTFVMPQSEHLVRERAETRFIAELPELRTVRERAETRFIQE